MISRYFNKVSVSNDVVVKTSSNIQKLYAEYMYYHLLPPSMPRYSVPTFNYTSNGDIASYSMPHILEVDSATFAVNNGALSIGLLPLLSTYINEKTAITSDVSNSFRDLFINKVISRFNEFIELHSNKVSSDALALYKMAVGVYLNLVNGLEVEYKSDVLSHGDLCLSNILYDGNSLNLIDPRGATVGSELFMHPLYDLAKLSHSILGGYDYIVRNKVDILSADSLLDFDLSGGEFEKFINKCGYDLRTVRILEASLFLSMLPLHTDDFNRIELFILRASQILGM